ncbi:LytR/AlgR family response regulator transcription factor [Taibaiella helva]|uniref:LytR/AlgR family response regulator transcription factor n=1 Tax=Taibaiella helva TaxID=2301235 RepID=UPI000E56AADA|nr:LytTR family transcriptional regulator DNA-binding domain-containing protein [Taibaiella helva]
MIHCLIIDDEQAAIDVIAAYIGEVPCFNLVGATRNPIEGLQLIHERQVDLLFLDIQMSRLTGLEVMQAINGKCKVIFTTAYDRYALDGFELNAIDYLLKPVHFPRFLKAAQKAQDILEPLKKEQAERDFIIVQGDSKGKLIKIDIADIDYIEGMRNYVAIVCGTQKILSLMNLKDLEENLLKKHFIRVHKSYIIPIANIASVDMNIIRLKRNGKVEIAIGNAYKAAFLEIMRANMIS